MLQVMIRLASVGDVKTFVGIARQYPYEIRLRSDQYTVTAKSIMGIFSLDLSREVLLEANTDQSASDCDLMHELQPFVAKNQEVLLQEKCGS